MKFVRLSDRAYILKQCRKINIYIYKRRKWCVKV